MSEGVPLVYLEGRESITGRRIVRIDPTILLSLLSPGTRIVRQREDGAVTVTHLVNALPVDAEIESAEFQFLNGRCVALLVSSKEWKPQLHGEYLGNYNITCREHYTRPAPKVTGEVCDALELKDMELTPSSYQQIPSPDVPSPAPPPRSDSP